jgi:hypothetical protein
MELGIKLLFLSNALDHPLTSRMHFLIQYLDENHIDAKIFDVSFYHKKQSFLKFLKIFFSFPFKTNKTSNRTICLPSFYLFNYSFFFSKTSC